MKNLTASAKLRMFLALGFADAVWPLLSVGAFSVHPHLYSTVDAYDNTALLPSRASLPAFYTLSPCSPPIASYTLALGPNTVRACTKEDVYIPHALKRNRTQRAMGKLLKNARKRTCSHSNCEVSCHAKYRLEANARRSRLGQSGAGDGI